RKASGLDRLTVSWTADRKASVPKLATRTREASDIREPTESRVSPDRRASPNANPATGAAIPAGIKRIPTLTKNPPTSLTEHDLPHDPAPRAPRPGASRASRSPRCQKNKTIGEMTRPPARLTASNRSHVPQRPLRDRLRCQMPGETRGATPPLPPPRRSRPG